MSAEQQNRPTILVVDNQPAFILILRQLLKKTYHVVTAVTGVDALAAVATAPPDLILLDVLMPELNGFEVCRRLKEDKTTRDIPIIFVTTCADSEDIRHGFGLGGADYLVKPFRLGELQSRITTHLKLTEPHHERCY